MPERFGETTAFGEAAQPLKNSRNVSLKSRSSDFEP